MRLSRNFAALVPGVLLAVAACSGSVTSASAPPSAVQLPVSAPPSVPVVAASASAVPATASPVSSPSLEPSASASGGGTTKAIDPCKLLTTSQASDVNKVNYSAGVSHRMSTGGVECVWESAPAASVVVQVLAAPDPSGADAAYAEAEAQAHGFAVTDIPDFADKAAIARAPAGTVNTGGIFVRDGNVFFDVVYLGGHAPTDDELKLAATLILGNIS